MAPLSEVFTFALNYGFAGLIAMLFWRYITTIQKEQTQTLRTLTNQVESMNDKLEERRNFYRGSSGSNKGRKRNLRKTENGSD